MFTVLGPKNFIVVLVGIVLFFVSFGLGKATAKREREFFYLEGTDKVLLGTYRDSYILKEYDKSAKIWKAGAILLRVDESKEIQLRHLIIVDASLELTSKSPISVAKASVVDPNKSSAGEKNLVAPLSPEPKDEVPKAILPAINESLNTK